GKSKNSTKLTGGMLGMSISPNGTVHRGAPARIGRVFTVINSAAHGAEIPRLIFYGPGRAWN
ncbi:hypothetical protein TorRG33x02_179510, partial [Trema orientale]